MFQLQKVLAKLDRPPAGHNFVRLVSDSPLATAKNCVNFARSQIGFNYLPASTVIRDRVTLGLSEEDAIVAVMKAGSPAGRKFNQSLVEAFFDWDRSRQYSAANAIEFERGFFRVSREIVVPVAPLCVIREHGKFVPLFLCGWKKLELTHTQRRLLVTICEDAFLSLTDFIGSPAEYLFFPSVKPTKATAGDGASEVRGREVWQRADYAVMSKLELSEQIEIFLEGRKIAHKMLADMVSSDFEASTPPSSDSGSNPNQGQFDL